MKKSAKELLYFGLDRGMMKFFTFKPQPEVQAGGLDSIQYEAAQDFEVF